MAHFAKLNNDNMVTEVIVLNNDVLDSENEEQSGIDFLTQWSDGYSNWKQTSYNNNIRFNYAGIGYSYDPERDAFIPPKPFNSWLLDETTCRWTSPVPHPTDGERYNWNEETLSWDRI